MARDENDEIVTVDIANVGDEYVMSFVDKYQPDTAVDQDDIDEVADLHRQELLGRTAGGRAWAVPLKQAIADAGGVLIADGRIHTDDTARSPHNNSKTVHIVR